ncbi:hypothetical protein SAMN02745216_02462 [Desulfatibacillum alkenivorans DSM 16219]|uniref:Uncharacterized protein n=1 Tax=Desulfatibacillum alkenivorans DSM 16219 TaxID=1121393 RepID=A0A1M6MW99_9BACT|nr:hypothetical protein [Desulfatibacillum alkenivorans]SHJ87696.1 hypothetical protein SAMN02745216_02462 [Desulfatibacillum alkenivorans DSM 16219]
MNLAAELDINTDLDEEIEGLFKDLGEDDAVEHMVIPDMPGLSETLHNEEQRMDVYRVHLVDFTRQVSSFLGASLSGGFRATEAAVTRLVERLSALHELGDHVGKVLIRHRGRGLEGEGANSAKYDYTVCFGALKLDIPLLKDAEKRLGQPAEHATVDFRNALKTMGSYGIHTLYASTLPHDAQARQMLRLCLNVLADYLRMFQEGKNLKYEGIDPWQGLPVVLNPAGFPDPNLTCLAAVNGLKPRTVSRLVDKIGSLMLDVGPGHPLKQYASVYDAVFGFEKLSDVLVRPPMEINNARWLINEHESQPLSDSQARLVRFLAREFPNGSQAPGKLVDSLYATDFGCVNCFHLMDRMTLASDLLKAMGKAAPHRKNQVDFSLENLEMEVLGNLEKGLARVSEPVLKNLCVSNDALVARQPECDEVRACVDERILDLVSFFHHRSQTKKKMESLPFAVNEFDRSDYQTIARDFGSTVDEAKDLVRIFKLCFDDGGHFIRPVFEENIPALARYQDHVFEFLWHYLQNSMHREDRIAFLNALQVLIDRMNQPQKALTVLLEDFIHDPETIQFHDRNALMLCSVLMRTFNKELHKDTEYTPQEVLKVKAGLDQRAVIHAREFLDANRERFFVKIRTIHTLLKQALGKYKVKGRPPTRYLLILEWEAYILLSLVGGAAAETVVGSALGEYGNPDSEIYHLPRSNQALLWLLLLLQVVAQGAARFGRPADAVLLSQIKNREEFFVALGGGERARKQIRNLVRQLKRNFK